MYLFLILQSSPSLSDSIIKVNWKDMEFDHEEHARTGHNLLRTSEELIETLEENQVRHEQANKET